MALSDLDTHHKWFFWSPINHSHIPPGDNDSELGFEVTCTDHTLAEVGIDSVPAM